MSETPPTRPKGGCLGLLAFLLIELIVGFGVGYLVASNLWAFLDARGWFADREVNGLIAIFTAMAVSFVLVYWIDGHCKRITGESAIDQIPFLP